MRALLRAADAGVLRVLLPFVTSADEFLHARTLIDAIRAELGTHDSGADRRDDRGPGGGADRRSVGAGARISSASGRTTSSSTRWPWTGPTSGWPDTTSRRAPAVLRLLRGIAARREACALRGGRLRRDGGRSAAGRPARRPGLPIVQHGPERDSRGQTQLSAPSTAHRATETRQTSAASATSADAVYQVLEPMAADVGSALDKALGARLGAVLDRDGS